MCPLTFIGLGLGGSEGLTLEALSHLSSADMVYLEAYTSPLEEDIVENLKAKTGKSIILLSRETVEDGRLILDKAAKENVILLVGGDPMVATTHNELRTRALTKKITVKIVHNASIVSALPGEMGLHIYKFGKTVTLTSSQHLHMKTAYRTVYDNLLKGLHTLLLLEYDFASKASLSPNQALAAMADMEKDEDFGVFPPDAFILVASRLGRPSQQVVGGTLESLCRSIFGEAPHVIVVPGRLHFTEEEALVALGVGQDRVSDNSLRVKHKAARMVSKYVAKSRIALQKARVMAGQDLPRLSALLENVECYLSDAERFLREGEDELAVLSVGYAEGLLDSLRLRGEVPLDW